jgi:adenylate cyclase
VEIERKFLVDRVPRLRGAEGVEIEQGYLAAEPGGGEVRLRRQGEELLLTAKRGAGLSRDEAEVELDRGQFEALWPLTEGRRLSKVRYAVMEGTDPIELDVYRGELDGLSVAEVEFASKQQAEEFHPPSWLGREVTGEEGYTNRSLAERGAP